MASRLKLHEELVNFLGSSNVYFQLPESVKLKYPCIIYSKENINSQHANDKAYKNLARYSVMFLTRDPDNTYAEDFLHAFSYSSFNRRYIVDNLYHDVLDLYY